MIKARLQEIFSSLQGEGVFVGEPHLFVRFNQCHILCRYCDSPETAHPFERTVDEVLEEVERLDVSKGSHQAVSLTGGEPLLQVDFLEELLPQLKARLLRRGFAAPRNDGGPAVYLETNGILVGALKRVLPWVDIVAMDIKPPSATGERAFWEEHEEFLRLSFARLGAAPSRANLPPELRLHRGVFVKVVTTEDTTEEDMRRSIEIVSRVDRAIPFVIQPVTPCRSVSEPVSGDALVRFNAWAEKDLKHVRVIPQVHKLLGIP